MRLAIFRQGIANLEPRSVEQVAQSVFVLIAVESTLGGAAFLREARSLLEDERRGQWLCERVQLGVFRPRLLLGRHLAGADAVMDEHPGGKVRGVRRIELEGGQIQAALLHLSVVALETMPFQELLAASGSRRNRR